jgi:hypothetical protein
MENLRSASALSVARRKSCKSLSAHSSGNLSLRFRVPSPLLRHFDPAGTLFVCSRIGVRVRQGRLVVLPAPETVTTVARRRYDQSANRAEQIEQRNVGTTTEPIGSRVVLPSTYSRRVFAFSSPTARTISNVNSFHLFSSSSTNCSMNHCLSTPF